MSFFYNLNKTLDAIREKPELKHGQLNERDMGKHNNKTTGFDALAKKAGKEYGSKEAGERVAGAVKAKMAKAGKLEEQDMEEGLGDMARKVGGMAKKVGGKVLDKLGHGDDAEMMRDLQRKMGATGAQVHGKKSMAEPNEGLGDALSRGFDKFDDAIAPIGAKLKGAKAFVTHNPKDYQAAADAHNKIAKKVGTDPRTGQPYPHPEREPAYRTAKANAAGNEYNKGRAQAGIGRVFETGDEEGGIPMTPKQKKFAAIAEPKDKITFADKIAGAKKEVDEMLGDVAAEAMKSALSGGQKKLDKNNNGKLDANDFEMLRKGGKKQVADEGFPTVASARDEMRKRKVGDVTHGAKHDTEETPTGRRVTRRLDPNTGYSVGSDTDGEGNAKSDEKRGRGRPKKTDKAPERVTANATKHKGGRKMTKEGAGPDDMAVLERLMDEAFAEGNIALGNAIQGVLEKMGAGDEEQVDEKAVSKKQQKFMGMVHATQKGEKAPSKEVAKVAKTMKKGDAEDFASTKHKGLPEKKKPEAKADAPKKKKEKTEEAGGTSTPTASSGFSFGQGIYDSMNRDLENMIKESMSINVSSSTDGQQNITVTASDEDAIKLAGLLKSAGLGGGSEEGYGGGGYKSACGCGTPDCSCGEEEMDEAAPAVNDNSPDWPTDQETAQDNFEYSGGLNKPKSTGQTTVPVIASQEERQGTYAEDEEDAIKRMMEMAGIKEGKKPDFLDVDKDGDKAEPFKKAVDDKKEKKVDEGILAATANLWSEYKGKYGV